MMEPMDSPRGAIVRQAPEIEMKPGQVLRLLIEDVGLEEKDLRVIVGVEQRSIEKWMSGETVPQKETRRRLNELAGLHVHLGETFTSYEGARLWLRAPLRYLAGLTPLQVLRAGDTK
jgi:ribosome-binding protein aMBF1 (putative translation factor)